ncbi:Preprotein translocase SecG subunit [Candidatus Thiomargarita nelsonii]|uniref:Protein-export membrane protein SecG n=1 Tax=Candidatus Thiomargarita nelsonii TaxID=1003181 RepID=A0A176S4Y2_9GAMM|nr:Preprotein translocase SecG subunit [Candidatus Thiomargarita nelsonii]
MLQDIFAIVHILICVGLVGLILIQHGKGADAGAAFGGGASGTVFGSQGSTSFLSRTTAVLATLFFVTCLTLAYFSIQRIEPKSALESAQPTSSTEQEESAVPTQNGSELPQVDKPATPTDNEIPSVPSEVP